MAVPNLPGALTASSQFKEGSSPYANALSDAAMTDLGSRWRADCLIGLVSRSRALAQVHPQFVGHTCGRQLQ